MKVGVSIRPILALGGDAQEFLEVVFADVENLKDVEVHTDNLDDFSIYLLELAEKLGVGFSVHCPHMYSPPKVNFCSAKEEDIKKADLWLGKSIEYAKKLGAEEIVIHPDKYVGCSREKALDILEKHIRDNIKSLGRGQRILIENMPGEKYALSTPEEFKEFLKRFRKGVGVCWDVGHEIIRLRKQEFSFPKVLGKEIKEVHISGVVKKGKRFSDHFPLTEGCLKLKECIDSLKKITYRGVIVFEILTKNPLDIIESKKLIDEFI